MFDDVLGGLKLALRRWPQTVSICGILLCISVIMMMFLVPALAVNAGLRASADLRSQDPVGFAAFTPHTENEADDTAAMSALATLVGEGAAYSAIVGNFAIADGEALGPAPTIVVTGDAVHAAFPSLGFACPDICLVPGSDVEPLGESLFLRNMTIPVTAPLERGAVWFDPNMPPLLLDDMQLLFLPPSYFDQLVEVERQELLTRVILLRPSPQQVDAFVKAVSTSDTRLVPQRLDIDESGDLHGLLRELAIMVVAFVAFCGLVAFAYGASLANIIDGEIRGFVIRRMCGATTARIAVRFLIFIAASTLVLPAALCFFLMGLGEPITSAAQVVLTALSVFYSVFGIHAVRIIHREVG